MINMNATDELGRQISDMRADALLDAAAEHAAACFTDGKITNEHRAMARAREAARPKTVRDLAPHGTSAPTLTRAEAMEIAEDARLTAEMQASSLRVAACDVGAAAARRLCDIAALLDQVAFDAETLLLDLRQGNYPASFKAEG